MKELNYMKRFFLLIFLLFFASIMSGCIVPEVIEDSNEQIEISINSFVQEINCGGEIYRLAERVQGLSGCQGICLAAQLNNCNCDCSCPEPCPPCEDCIPWDCEDCTEWDCLECTPWDCDECDCPECKECEECEECYVDPCCGYFALGDLIITVEANGTGTIDEISFLVTYNDGTTEVISAYTDWAIDGTSIKEITIPVNGRVVFVELS
jgi:hypothetical protein